MIDVMIVMFVRIGSSHTAEPVMKSPETPTLRESAGHESTDEEKEAVGGNLSLDSLAGFVHHQKNDDRHS